MLIGIDASRANRSVKTGVEWYSYHLIKNLYQLDLTNQYFLYTDKKLIPDLAPSQNNFQEKVLAWPFSRFWTLGRLSLEMLKSKPDILFVPSHTFPLVGGKKNVITWHDVGYERYPETYGSYELASLKQGIKRALKMADKIIAISEFTKQEMIRIYGVRQEKIVVVHLGCNHQRWQPPEAAAIRSAQSRHHLSEPYFIYLGRLALRKNIVGLIRAYNLFRQKPGKPYQLLLVGPISDLSAEIDEEIKASPYQADIKKIGWLKREDLPYLVAGARALVSTSIYEGFGLPALEAMACGTPVIASTSGAFPEVVGKAGLLCDAHDPECFAQMMAKVSSDDNLREDLIQRGFKRAAEFSWEKCAAETLAILNSV